MIDLKSMIRQVESMQERIGEFYEQLGALKLAMQDLIEDNQRLSLENANLRERARLYVEGQQPVVGEAAKYLGKIYEDGFHICNVNYGSLRKGDCLFCLQNLQRTS